jgi:hypothetical protein
LDVGALVALDQNGELIPAVGDLVSHSIGVVRMIRDATPDAAEILQPMMTLEMGISDRREILHPTRNETCVVTTDRSGVPAFEATDHFHMMSYRTVNQMSGMLRTIIHWRPS